MSEYGDVINQMFGSATQDAKSSVVPGVDDDPERAAKAISLESATGTPSPWIYSDQDFETQLKIRTTQRMMEDNPHLVDYANSHPLASKVSSDDWGQLDKLSQSLDKRGVGSIMSKAVEGFKEGFDYEGLQREYESLYNYIDSPLWKSFVQQSGFGGAAVTLAGSQKLFNALITGGAAAIGEASTQLTGSEAWGGRLARDIIGLAQVGMANQAGFHVAPELQSIARAASKAAPWIKAGKTPPVGVDPLIDQIHTAQAKLDAKNHDEAFQDAKATATGERAPEFLANYIRLHTNDEISIPAEAVRRIYVDKEPTPEDNLLGWVPDIARQLQAAETHSGNIEVPLADWLAKAPKEVAKELHDDLVLRPGGISLNEAKELKPLEEPKAAEEPDQPKLAGEATPEDTIRTASGFDPLFREGAVATQEKGPWTQITKSLRAILPEEVDLTPTQRAIVDRVSDEINRIAPRLVEHGPATAIEIKGRPVRGAYQRFTDELPVILYSIDRGMSKAIGTGRHEAVHHLIDMGFFYPVELRVMKAAAKEYGWFDKELPGGGTVRSRYAKAHLSPTDLLYEAMVHRFEWWEGGHPADNSLVGGIFLKMKGLFDRIRSAVREEWNKAREAVGLEPAVRDPTWEEIFAKIESGEIGRRRGVTPQQSERKGFQPYFPAMAAEEGEIPRPPGMTKERWQRYQRLMERRNEEDIKRQQLKALTEQRREQGKEWKENRVSMKQEVEDDIQNRPDVAAAAMLRNRMLFGEKVGMQVKLDEAKLSLEQKAALPKEFYGPKGGIDPDAAAGIFGYTSGAGMIERVAQFEKARGDTPFKDYVSKIVETETDRRMRQKYGDLDANVLNEAMDHVISPTQMDLLHEETMALATRIGAEDAFPSKAEWKRNVEKDFNENYKVSQVKRETFLRMANKAFQAVEDALLKGDEREAFKQGQMRYTASLLAEQAKKFEKNKDKLYTLAKQLAKRQQPGQTPRIAPEYANFAHEILMRVMPPGFVKRSVQDLQTEIAQSGYKDLLSFVIAKEDEAFGMREIPVADFLLDSSYRKPVEQMTINEFYGLKQSLETLNKQGRDDMKLVRGGEEADKQTILDQMKEKLRTFPTKEYPATPRKRDVVSKLPRAFLAASTSNETLLNRWDRNDPRGVFNQYVIRPLSDAATYKAKLQRKYKTPYQALGKLEDPGRLIDSPIKDPLKADEVNPDGLPFDRFTNSNKLVMLQNAGNESNWKVMARGYKADPEQLRQWLFQNTTKNEWDRAQALGNIFGNIFKEAETTYRNIYGVPPEKLELKPIQTPFGTYQGWYHPLIRDPLREGPSKKQRGGGVYDDNDYGHASLANGYTKRRTGAIYPLSLEWDQIPIRMSQMLHDISYRAAVLQVEKIFNDRDFRAVVAQHYGAHYRDGLMPYLKGIAGEESINSRAMAVAASASEYLRQNVIGAYIGLNPYTVLKHGPTAWVLSMKQVGVGNWLRATADLYRKSDDIAGTNRDFVDQWSGEVPRRMRHWADTISGVHKDIYGKGTLRERILELGAWPVAQSDLFSVRGTFLAEYRNAILDGQDHGQAVYEGDRAVRFAHGTTAITNLPAIVSQGGPLHNWLTTLYGFFGTMMQRRIEIFHKLSDAYQLGKGKQIAAAAGRIPDIATSIMVYFVIPTWIEEQVTGLTTDDKRGWGTHILTGALMGAGSSVIYARDIIHSLVTGHEPGVGLISSPLHDIKNLAHDLGKGRKILSKENAGKTIQDGMTVFGEATGMAPKIVGSAARFGIDVGLGRAHPKTFTDWRMGLTRGQMKPKVQR